MAYVDFNELKQRFTIEKVAGLLCLTLKQSGQSMRGACPACGSGGDRAIVVTPSKGVWYCWAAHVGGDLIALAAHIRKCEMKDAAAWLDAGTVPSKKGTSGNQVPPNGDSSLRPLDLEYDHPAVAALGFSHEEAQQLGIGYCSRGIMKGLVVAPIRLTDGVLSGYIGLTDIAKLPPRWQGIEPPKVVPIKSA
jgi:hypothetical protein